jgi:ribosome-binding ATPase YchF (GTP1/OBG family)
VKAEGAQVVLVSAAIEAQIADMEDPEEKEMFSCNGLTEGLNKLHPPATSC